MNKPHRTTSGRVPRLAAAAALVIFVGGAACSEDTTDSVEEDVRSAITDAVDVADEAGEDAVEVAARLFAAEQGAQEFDESGHPLDGELACTSDASDDLTAVDIDCTGTTEDGAAAELTGTTSELPGLSITELDGDFVGTVDGTEVFQSERLGG